jgi:hypothetical protein
MYARSSFLAVLTLVSAAAVSACGGSHRTDSTATGNIPRSEYTNQVDGSLVRLASNARTQGYSRVVAGPIYGRLSNDASESHQMQVVEGNDYALLGGCDNDCSDINLRVYDAAGTMLMEDMAGDDTPVLTFTARSSGRYRVESMMAACSRNPCFYGIQLMAK